MKLSQGLGFNLRCFDFFSFINVRLVSSGPSSSWKDAATVDLDKPEEEKREEKMEAKSFHQEQLAEDGKEKEEECKKNAPETEGVDNNAPEETRPGF